MIESDLDVFVGILNHDDAVAVNVCALPFGVLPKIDYATRLPAPKGAWNLAALKGNCNWQIASVRG